MYRCTEPFISHMEKAYRCTEQYCIGVQNRASEYSTGVQIWFYVVLSPGEGVLPEDAIGSEDRGPALDPERQVDHFKGDHTQDVDLEVPVSDVILGALLAVCFIYPTRIKKHDPWSWVSILPKLCEKRSS